MKDALTQLLGKGSRIQAAVADRAIYRNILVYKSSFNPDDQMTIATGSFRRKSQWLNTKRRTMW
jgi:hydroxymethylbilane synthase